MKKAKIIILFISFFVLISFAQQASAQYINYAAGGTVSFEKTDISSVNCSAVWYDTASNINDDDEDNYVGGRGCASDYTSGDRVKLFYTAVVALDEAADVDFVEFVYSKERTPMIMVYPCSVRVYIQQGGAWNQIGANQYSTDNPVSKKTITIASGVPWANVTGVKIEIGLQSLPQLSPAWLDTKIYEIRAWGSPPPCEAHDTWGYAWSDNIGWINFSCIEGTGSPHWQEVDDVVPDDSATRVWTDSGSEQRDAYELQDPPAEVIPFDWIFGVRVKMKYQGTIKTYLRLYDIEIEPPEGEGSAFAWEELVTDWQDLPPGPVSWDWEKIRDLQVVAGLSQGQLTQIYIEVDYSLGMGEHGTLILRPNGDGDYIKIENPHAGASVDYGVDIDESTGNFSGYAWSDNIGWISFEPGDLAGCPSGAPCQARLDLDGTTCGEVGQVCGWARALAPVGDPNAGGWDGWIKLRDSSYGVSLNPAPTPSEFESWAWGGGYSGGNIGAGVIGWISFNDRDITGSPGPFDYQVMTDITFTLNDIPSATNLSVEQTSGCESAPIVRFSWDYNDDDNVPPGTDPQSAYEIQIDDDPNLDEDPFPPLSGGSDTYRDYSPPNFGTTYWWRVRVRDNNGPVWSDWANGPNFTPIRWPEPDFTWCPEEPDVGEPIRFCSVFEAGVCSPAAEPACNLAGDLTTCAAGCILWEWDFDNDGTPEITSTDNPTYSYSSSGDYTVRLTVTDADGHSCYKVKDLSTDISLPVWKEIPPF